MSPWMEMERPASSGGTAACAALMQAYTARGFSRVICQNGYLMMTGVLPPTPSSQKRMRRPLWRCKKAP